MDTSALNRGDRVQCNVKGLPFTATIVDFDEHAGRWQVEDTQPKVGYCLLSSRQILKKLGEATCA